MKNALSERLNKFLLMLVVTPFLIVLMLILAGLMVSLPLVALIAPQVIKINEGNTNGRDTIRRS
jgi:hypothetical protein